jgi:Spy/CpxP family protein refolding chaperone
MRAFVRTLVVFGSVALLAGVASGARADSPPSPSASPTAAPEEQKAKSEANDIVQMIDEAMAHVTLRPDQTSTFKQLASDVDAHVAGVDEAKRAALLALADQIEANKVDAASLEPQTKKFVDAAAAASPYVRKALEKVHDNLDAQQRKEFVEGFRDALKKRKAMLDPKAHLERLSKDLNLSDDQKDKIQAILAENTVANDVARDRLELVLAAFPGDTFKMDELLPAEGGLHAERMAKRAIDIAAKVTPILTPEQRKLAADKIRKRASGRSTGESPAETSGTGPQGTEASSAELEALGSASEPLWAGAAGGYGGYAAGGYRSYSGGYGFSTGYAGGVGGTYLF